MKLLIAASSKTNEAQFEVGWKLTHQFFKGNALKSEFGGLRLKLSIFLFLD